MVQSKLVRRMSGPARKPQYQRTPVRPPRPARAFSADLAQRPNRSDLWRVTVKPDEQEDVIDLGAPRAVRASRCLLPERTPRGRLTTYTPNPRLYPGPPKPDPTRQRRIPTGQRKRKKRAFRLPVPNSRLYRPPPPRPQPPPARPPTVWQPPAPALALETASRAALRLNRGLWWPTEKSRTSSPTFTPVQKRSPKRVPRRRKSPTSIASRGPERRRNLTPEPLPRLVITLPAAAGDGDSTREEPPPPRYRPASQHFRDRELRTPSDSTPTGARAASLPLRHIMDATQRHSASPEDCSEGNDSLSAPSEFLAEFLSAIMRRQYAEALKYCRLILQYEPHNATARGFYPLLQQKLALQSPRSSLAHSPGPPHSRSSTRRRRTSRGSRSPTDLLDLGASSGNSGESSPVCQTPNLLLPHEVMEQDADSLCSGSDGSASSGEEEPSASRSREAGPGPGPGSGPGSVSSQSSLELDSSDANARSSPSLSLSRRTDDRTDNSGSASASGTWESSGSGARDDNGNPAPAHPAPPAPAHSTPPLSCACDADNNTAAPARSPPRARPRPVTLQSEQSESLARLRAQFTCSIK